MVGRSNLKDGSCVNIEQCMKMIKFQKEKKEEKYKRTNILNSKYFEEYRHNRARSLRSTDRSRSQEDCPQKETD